MAGFFGTSVNLGTPLFEYHTPHSFTGDGYSFAVHSLPESLRRRFSGTDKELLSGFPETAAPQGWTVEHWRATPVENRLAPQIEFLTGPTDTRDAVLNEHLTAMETVLQNPGAFYAMIHRTTTGVHNVHLTVVDLCNDRLYLVVLDA